MTDAELYKLSALFLGMPWDSMSVAQHDFLPGETLHCLPQVETRYIAICW